MSKPNIAHASISSMGAYSDCGKRWEFKYVHKLPEKSKLALKIGSTNHAILESVNHWIRDKKTAPDKEYYDKEIERLVKMSLSLELFLEHKRISKADKALSDEEFCEKQRNEAISQLRKMCNLYIDKASEKFKEIVLIEQEHVVVINNIPFKLVADAVVRFNDDSLRVLDYKTRAKFSGDVALLQLVGYAIGIEDLLKEKVTGLEQWDFIKKSEPEIVVHQVDMSKIEQYKKVLLEELPTFWHGVHNRLFTRNMRSMYCGPDKCDYWKVCMEPGKLEADKQSVADFHKETISNLEHRRK